jgi:hypothetical protein
VNVVNKIIVRRNEEEKEKGTGIGRMKERPVRMTKHRRELERKTGD